MNNADVFKQVFGIYATELWAMGEKDFLEWLNSEHDPQRIGHWIEDDDEMFVICSECGEKNDYTSAYAPTAEQEWRMRSN